MRGNPADYNEWRQRGCTGWDWDSVLPFFKKAEDPERGPSETHGLGGPSIRFAGGWPNIGAPPRSRPVSPRTTISTMGSRTAPPFPMHDESAPPLEHGCRLSAPGPKPGEPVDRNRRACHPSSLRERPRRGDRISHPWRHQIGPRERAGNCLRRVLRLAAIAAAFRDRPGRTAPATWRRRGARPRRGRRKSLNDVGNKLWRTARAGAQYAVFQRGPLASNGVCAGAFARSDPRLDRPDIQLNSAPGALPGATDAASIRTRSSASVSAPCTCAPMDGAMSGSKAPSPSPHLRSASISCARAQISRR